MVADYWIRTVLDIIIGARCWTRPATNSIGGRHGPFVPLKQDYGSWTPMEGIESNRGFPGGTSCDRLGGNHRVWNRWTDWIN